MKFNQSVTVTPYVSEDVYGKRTYGTPVTLSCLIDYTIKNIKDFDGNNFLTAAWIAFPTGTVIHYTDKITLPDGTHPYIGSISEIKNHRDGTTHYLEVYTGRVAPGQGML